MGILNTNTPGLNQNVDSTTYIYHSANEAVPLTTHFLNFQYLTSDDRTNIVKNQVSKALTKKSSSLGFAFQYSDFVFVVIIFMFSLLAYVRFYGKNYYSRILTSIFNYSYSASFFKEKNLAFVLNSNFLMTVFFVCSTLLIGVVEEYFKVVPPNSNKWILLALNFSIIVVMVVFYKLANRFCGLLFGQYRLVTEYLFYFGNLLKITGIVFLILLMGAFFSNEFWKHIFVYLTIFITIIVYLIKISRVLLILFRNRFSLYYLILYFCALEIVPIMLLVKIFMLIMRSNSHIFSTLV